ncbi:cell wall-binding repeat-containing protein [Kineococcus siccus]|uniref:cell wall-binding repeat-containing protein n=1 Tax=Kineococcus siccus TaxID=2696567 RepID=UPI00141255E3
MHGSDLFIADTGLHMIFKVSGGVLTPHAGTGTVNSGPITSGPATTRDLGRPTSLAVDSSGTLYVADSAAHQAYRIDGNQVLTVIAGTGTSGSPTPGSSPTAATSSPLDFPYGIAVTSTGDVFISNPNDYTIVEVSGGALRIVAGTSTQQGAAAAGPATGSLLNGPAGLSVDEQDNLYVAESYAGQVDRITPAGALSVLAGNGNGNTWPTYDAVATSTSLYFPAHVSVGPDHQLYVSDTEIFANPPRSGLHVIGYPAPASVTAVGAPGALTVSWTLPSTSADVTGYTATASPGGATCTSTSTTCSIPGTAGVAYSVAVVASYGVASSRTASAVGTATPTTAGGGGGPVTPPVDPRAGAPSITTAVGAGTAATVSFTPPSVTGASAITSYRLTVTGGDLIAPRTVQGPRSPIVVGGLTAGQTYTFTVAALNASGAGAGSNAVTTRWETLSVPVEPGVTRLAGGDRNETAVAVSKALFPADGRATAAVIATSATYADSIAGGRLSSAIQGPLLLTGTAALDADVAQEIRRLVTPGGKVYVLGQTGALSQQVRDALAELNSSYSIARVGGRDRYETAAAIADVVTAHTGEPDAPIYLASGSNYPDGLAVAALAGSTGGVVLLTADGTLPPATSAYLQAKDPTGGRTTTVGGPAARAYPAARTSVVGRDRYDTAARIATRFAAGTTTVGIASGTDWPDALVGAAAMGIVGGPLLLTRPDNLNSDTEAVIENNEDLDASWVFGGPEAIASTTENQLIGLLPPP